MSKGLFQTVLATIVVGVVLVFAVHQVTRYAQEAKKRAHAIELPHTVISPLDSVAGEINIGEIPIAR